MKELIDIANNVINCNTDNNIKKSSKLSNNTHKSISNLFSKTYSLRDATLYGILSSKSFKRHSQHIQMTIEHLENLLGFDGKDTNVNNDNLIYLCRKDSIFGFYYKYKCGYISLFDFELNKDRTYIRFDLSSNFIKLLDGTAIINY